MFENKMHCSRHHIETFNYFSNFELQNIICGEMPLEIQSEDRTTAITFINAHFGKPNCSPEDARLKNLTYHAPIFVDIKEIITQSGKTSKNIWYRQQFTTIPIPVSPNKIKHDPGGYFIIRGKERVVVSQLRMAYNSPFISKNGETYSIEARFCNSANMHTTQIKLEYQKDDIFVYSTFFKSPILLAHLLVIYGECPTLFNKTHLHYQSIRRINWLMKSKQKESLLEFLAHDLKTFTGDIVAAEKIIIFELFPHISFFASNSVKARQLCFLADELLLSVSNNSIAERFERDNLCNKRLEPAGILCAELFRQMFKKFCVLMKKEFEKKIINPNVKQFIVKNNIISKKFLSCFMNPAWGAQQNGYVRIGVSQILCSTNYPSILSHLQRVSIPVVKDTKNTQLRQLHPSHLNYICGCESPEGMNIGLVLNLTAFCRISPKAPQVALRNYFQQYTRSISGSFVFYNGIEIGQTDLPNFVDRMKEKRSRGLIPWFVSFYDTSRIIWIWADEGRFLVENNSNVWTDPLEKYQVKWQSQGSQMFGSCASLIPNINHSPAPRACYGSNMIKQAIGHVFDDMLQRTETTLYFLHYPQKMLVSTETAQKSFCDEMPFGVNVVVAILSESGFNQEDACVIHKGAIERGLFVSSVLMTFCEEETSEIKISIPQKDIQRHEWNYNHLESTGVPKVGQILFPNDVIIGKWYQESGKKSVDNSIVVKKTPCIVSFVYLLFSEVNQRLVKVVVREINIPIVGDKFSSLISQKGVDGLICPTADMPFTKDGMIPDIVINPHAIPSRMTISQLIDMVLGKEAALSGKEKNGTSFLFPQQIGKELEKYGFNSMGSEIMFSGKTGRKYKTPIFIGPTYYMRLKHLVNDKIHARDSGCVTALTRSAPEGRRRDGGLKFGEMERDALLAHGTSQMLLERLFKFADDYSVLVCSSCFEIVYGANCKACNVKTSHVSIPYIFKLIKQELGAMNLKLELKI